MALGIRLGRGFDGLGEDIDRIRLGDVSLPVGIGLIWMMYPVLARVRYSGMLSFTTEPRLMGASLTLNWIVGPLLMFALAWMLLPDHPEYRNGLVLVGLARCIAMVLIWNMLAKGSEELAALLVALNSVFQILFYSVLGWVFLTVVPEWLGSDTASPDISMWLIARNVLLFLGLPLAAGFITRVILVRMQSLQWYEEKFISRLAPTALIGLLYTIAIMFITQGDSFVDAPFDVVRITLPLGLYFLLMFSFAFLVSVRLGFDYEQTTSVSFTAAGNNFELAIAVAICVFGISSNEAFATVVGPLVEVPVLIGLVYLSLSFGRRFFRRSPAAENG
jgi:ACR3 family arsenite transporter